MEIIVSARTQLYHIILLSIVYISFISFVFDHPPKPEVAELAHAQQ